LPLLAIDTATEVLALALSRDGSVLSEAGIEAGRSHLELLLPQVRQMLDDNGLAIGDVRGLAVGVGPGTFSGLRVGIATARAFSQALEAPLAGFSTLEAVALELAGKDPAHAAPVVMPLIDAKRGQVFAQLFRKADNSDVAAISGILCLDPEDLVRSLAELTTEPILAGGNGAIAYRDRLAGSSQLELLDTGDTANRVRASWHLRAIRDGISFEPRQLLSVTPVYVREPDADKTILLRKREPWLK